MKKKIICAVSYADFWYMETISEQMNDCRQITAVRRQCTACGAANISAAKFCGSCGAKIPAATIIRNKRSKRSRRRVYFRAVLVLAGILVAASAVMSYQLFNRTDGVKVSPMPFADVPADHPVYRTCRNLLEIQAVSYRKILEFAPHETISPAEWNHALNSAAAHMKIAAPAEAMLPENSKVTVDALRSRVGILDGDPEWVSNTSRIKAYFCLEQIFFGTKGRK